MSNQPQNTTQSEEIDLGYLFNKIGLFFKNCIKILFLILAFFQKYIIITILLIIIGVAYGYYKDKTSFKIYSNEAIVIPNFGSVDYLYGKVNALNAKIDLRDSLFLKEILDTNFRYVRRIDIEPIVDVYNFASQSRENLDIFRTLFQNQELSEFVQDIITSKYYKYHRLNFIIIGDGSSEKIIQDILQYINTNEHFSAYQDVTRHSTTIEIAENANMMAQVDSVFKAVISFSASDKSSQSLFINDNSQLNNLLTTKRGLLEDRFKLLMRDKDQTEIIKLVSVNYNIQPQGFILSNLIKYPILLIFLFSFIFFMIYVFKKLKAIAEDN